MVAQSLLYMHTRGVLQLVAALLCPLRIKRVSVSLEKGAERRNDQESQRRKEREGGAGIEGTQP